MNADELADHVADTLNSISDPIVVAEAVKPDDLGEVSRETDNYQVFVVPFNETETRINRGDVCDERKIVSVTVVGPIGSVTRATALAFVEQLRRALRQTIFEGFRWMSNETTHYYDPDNQTTKGMFYSTFNAEYAGLA